MVYRKYPNRLNPAKAQALLEAILECRRVARLASAGVIHGCPAEHALNGLVRAIDALAAFLTRLHPIGPFLDREMGGQLHTPARNNRPSVIDDPALLLGDMRICRNIATASLCDVVPLGATYQAIEMVLASMDALVILLTGEAHYFSAPPSGATLGQAAAYERKRAREKGDM